VRFLAHPPLPKFALGQAPPAAAGEPKWSARLREVDVIYFRLTKGRGLQPVQRVIESVQSSGRQLALGWGILAVTQQPLLDQWQREEISTQELLDRLAVAEHSAWLQPGLRPTFLQVALGAPAPLLRKLRSGTALTLEEAALLPRGYRPRPDALNNFLDRSANSARLRRFNPARLYRAHLAAEQTIAENVVRFGQTHPETKLIVLLPDDPLIDPREVAEFAAQKSHRRQMILDREPSPNESHSRLLAAHGRPFQVVDRSPGSSRDHGRLASPRLRTGAIGALLFIAPKEIARL
jgi:Haem-binding uptake, Tiki superfamily, ChaN